MTENQPRTGIDARIMFNSELEMLHPSGEEPSEIRIVPLFQHHKLVTGKLRLEAPADIGWRFMDLVLHVHTFVLRQVHDRWEQHTIKMARVSLGADLDSNRSYDLKGVIELDFSVPRSALPALSACRGLTLQLHQQLEVDFSTQLISWLPKRKSHVVEPFAMRMISPLSSGKSMQYSELPWLTVCDAGGSARLELHGRTESLGGVWPLGGHLKGNLSISGTAPLKEVKLLLLQREFGVESTVRELIVWTRSDDTPSDFALTLQTDISLSLEHIPQLLPVLSGSISSSTSSSSCSASATPHGMLCPTLPATQAPQLVVEVTHAVRLVLVPVCAPACWNSIPIRIAWPELSASSKGSLSAPTASKESSFRAPSRIVKATDAPLTLLAMCRFVVLVFLLVAGTALPLFLSSHHWAPRWVEEGLHSIMSRVSPPSQPRPPNMRRALSKAEGLHICSDKRFIIAPSSISKAGNGVFVGDRITKGQTACYYDGIDLNADQISMSNPSPYIIQSSHGIRDGYRKQRNPCGVCQLINDAATLKITLPLTLSKVKAAIEMYESTSLLKTNLYLHAHDPYLMYASRDLEPSDELFISYGASYWLTRAAVYSGKPCIWLIAMMVFPGGFTHTDAITYDDVMQEVTMADGRPLTNLGAHWFIKKVMRLRDDSPIWSLPGVDAAGSSPAVRLSALVKYIVADNSMPELEFELAQEEAK